MTNTEFGAILYDGTAQSCDSMVQEAFTAGLQYSSGVSIRYQIVVIALLVITLFSYAFILKKRRTFNDGVTTPEYYGKIIEVLVYLFTYILICAVYIFFVVFNLW